MLQVGERTRRLTALLASLVLASALAACGSSGASSGSAGAQTLLKQTFSGAHAVNSGILSFGLTINPSGSSTIRGPISLALSGPFQSRGAGRLPASNLGITIDALGHQGVLGLVSTGTAGYITLKGVAYQLPAADFQKLASSFSGAGGGTGALARLGIRPLRWLTHPTVVGSGSVAGAPTTHIRAGVDVATLLGDLSNFLGKAAASGATGSAGLGSTLSAATRQRIAAAIKNPSVDVWTGASDHTLRRLSINVNVPVTGTISTLLGGLSSAGIGLTLQYANLNQPQTIATPGNVQPFSRFSAKLQAILAQVKGTLGGGGTGAASGTGSSGTGAATTARVQKYSRCLQGAGGDVTKMQKCSSLLNAR